MHRLASMRLPIESSGHGDELTPPLSLHISASRSEERDISFESAPNAPALRINDQPDLPQIPSPTSNAPPRMTRSKSALIRKCRVIGSISAHFQQVRELNELQNNEAQTEHDLIELQYFLQSMLDEQEIYVEVKKSIDGSIQRTMSLLSEDLDAPIRTVWQRLEPDMRKLSDLIHSEIKYYSNIKNQHQVTLAKLGSAITLLQSESAIRAKLIGKKEKFQHEAANAQKTLASEISTAKEHIETIRKLEFTMKIITSLRDKEVREKARLVTLNAQLENDLDRTKKALDEETLARKRLQKQVAELQAECKELEKKLLDSESLAESMSSATLVSQVPSFPSKFPSVNSVNELNQYASMMHERFVKQAPRPPSLSVNSYSLDYRQVSPKYFPSHQNQHAKTPRPPKKTPETPRSVPTTTRASQQPQTPRTPQIGKSDTAHHNAIAMSRSSTTKPSVSSKIHLFWIPTVSLYQKPKSYPLLHQPTAWFLKLSNANSDISSVCREYGNQLMTEADCITQQRYTSWIHLAENIFYSFLKYWQPNAPEVDEYMSQFVWIFHDAGMHYYELGNYESALSILKKAENFILKSSSATSDGLRYALFSAIACVLYSKQKFTNSLLYLQRAHRLASEKNPLRMLETHARMACVLSATKNPGESIRHLLMSLRFAEILPSNTDGQDSRVMSNALGHTDDALSLPQALRFIYLNLAAVHIQSRNPTAAQPWMDSYHRPQGYGDSFAFRGKNAAVVGVLEKMIQMRLSQLSPTEDSTRQDSKTLQLSLDEVIAQETALPLEPTSVLMESLEDGSDDTQ